MIYKEKIKTLKQKGVVMLAEDCINPQLMGRKAYKSDLNNEQWQFIHRFFLQLNLVVIPAA